jgi:hypothetical protein
MVNGTLLNFSKRYEVALRFGCAKQSKNLERCLLHIWCIAKITKLLQILYQLIKLFLNFGQNGKFRP